MPIQTSGTSSSQFSALRAKQALIENYRVQYTKQPKEFAIKLAHELSQQSKILHEVGYLDEAFTASQEAAALYREVLGVPSLSGDEIATKPLQCMCDSTEDLSPNRFHRELQGAAADVDHLAKFLESEYKISPGHITNLRDGTATRQNILHSIKSLVTNPRIKHGYPILIYFAGHGGVSRQTTEKWKEAGEDNVGQAIFPFDYDKIDDSSKPVECIPKIAELLSEPLATEGDNIPVIYDLGPPAPTEEIEEFMYFTFSHRIHGFHERAESPNISDGCLEECVLFSYDIPTTASYEESTGCYPDMTAYINQEVTNVFTPSILQKEGQPESNIDPTYFASSARSLRRSNIE
ncbi:hypothetical protein FRC11_010482, partial [Ceratobasidium sp. 423]